MLCLSAIFAFLSFHFPFKMIIFVVVKTVRTYYGKVLLFEVFYPNDSLKKIKVRKKNIKKKNIKKVWEFLNHCSKDNRFNIDGSKLNITRIEDSEGILKYSSRSDAVNNIIEICQNENYTFLESYDPEYCIEQKQSEFEERQKFVNLITEIEKLIK